MENKNLNDIVIDDAENTKKTQLKNILTLLALLFIILVISIIITKLILGEDTESATDKTVSQVTQNAQATEENNSDTSAITTTAITTTAVAAAAGATLVANSNDADESKKTPKLTERNGSTPVVEPTKEAISSLKQPLREYQDKKKETRAPSSSTKTYSKPKYIPNAEKPKATPKKEAELVNASRGYYIKVGAFEDPTVAINKIKAIKLNYRTIKSSTGLTRVLIGPFYSQKDAENHLAKAKANVAKDAYITKIK